MSNLSPAKLQSEIQADYLARTVGASFAGSGGMGGGVNQFIAPASNVNGIVIRSRALMSGSIGSAYLALMAGATAPGAWNSGEQYLGVTSATFYSDDAVYLPPGYGVWAASNTSTGHVVRLSYDIL